MGGGPHRHSGAVPGGGLWGREGQRGPGTASAGSHRFTGDPPKETFRRGGGRGVHRGGSVHRSIHQRISQRISSVSRQIPSSSLLPRISQGWSSSGPTPWSSGFFIIKKPQPNPPLSKIPMAKSQRSRPSHLSNGGDVQTC